MRTLCDWTKCRSEAVVIISTNRKFSPKTAPVVLAKCQSCAEHIGNFIVLDCHTDIHWTLRRQSKLPGPVPKNRLTQRQLEILQHALGLDSNGQGRSYRNHFCAADRDTPDCKALIELGLAEQLPYNAAMPYFNIAVTQAGVAAVARESPRPKNITKSQARYQAYLDADSGLTFHDWLQRTAPAPRGAAQ